MSSRITKKAMVPAGSSCARLNRPDSGRLIQVQDHAFLRYNLACHECRLGRLEQAKHWLQKAFEVGDPQRIKLMALDDPDLKPLWRDIGSA